MSLKTLPSSPRQMGQHPEEPLTLAAATKRIAALEAEVASLREQDRKRGEQIARIERLLGVGR